MFQLQISYVFTYWNNQQNVLLLDSILYLQYSLYRFSFHDTQRTCILSDLICDTTCIVSVVIRGVFEKRPNFLNNVPTSTEGVLRLLSAPRGRFWQQTAICPSYMWHSMCHAICHTCNAGSIVSVWWWCTIQLVLCHFWYTRYKLSHIKLCFVLKCAVTNIICYIGPLKTTQSCILIIIASDLPINVLVV